MHKGLGHSAATLIVPRTLWQLVLDVDGIFLSTFFGGGTTDMDGHNSDMTPLGAERLNLNVLQLHTCIRLGCKLQDAYGLHTCFTCIKVCRCIASNHTRTTCLRAALARLVAVPSTDQRCLDLSSMPLKKAKAAKAIAKAPAGQGSSGNCHACRGVQ